MQQDEGESKCVPPRNGEISAGGTSSVKIAPGWVAAECNELNGTRVCKTSKICKAGTIGTSNQLKCLGCPAGYTSFQGSLECLACEPGKFAPKPASPNCTLCDTNQVENYTDNQGSKMCKTCEVGKVSVGYKCTTPAVDTTMPVPSNVLVGPYNGEDDNGRRINVTWKIQDDPSKRGTKNWSDWISTIKSFVIGISVNPDFPVDANRTKEYKVALIKVYSSPVMKGNNGKRLLEAQQQYINMKVVLPNTLFDWPTERDVQPLWKSLRFARIQSVGEQTTQRSSISGRSGEWVTADFCSADEWLDDSYKLTECWKCRPCPSGASCLGAIKSTGIKAKFGYSRCRATTEEKTAAADAG